MTSVYVNKVEAESRRWVENILQSEEWEKRDKSDDNEIWRADITQGETLSCADNLIDATDADYEERLSLGFKKAGSVLTKIGCIATAAVAIGLTYDYQTDLNPDGTNKSFVQWVTKPSIILPISTSFPIGMLACGGLFHALGHQSAQRVKQNIAKIQARRQQHTNQY